VQRNVITERLDGFVHLSSEVQDLLSVEEAGYASKRDEVGAIQYNFRQDSPFPVLCF
jgi:hypothetical protein